MPSKICIRDFHFGDIYQMEGFRDCLAELAPCDVLTNKQIEDIYATRQMIGMRTLVAVIDNRIVGTASLFIEPKFIHNGGKVAHVDDVAVTDCYQVGGIGKALMERIIDIAKLAGCYKIILDCSPSVVPFYKKLGFYTWQHAMRQDL